MAAHHRHRPRPRRGRRLKLLAGILVALVSATLVVSCFSKTRRPPIDLRNLKLVSYDPANAPWTAMWADFEPTQIGDDFARIKALDANGVRLLIDPTQFGWPDLRRHMEDELAQVVRLAQDDGLYVQLTLFDWWSDYTDVRDSKAWVSALLAPYRDDPEIAFVELKNEIDPGDPSALIWARAVLPVARSAAGSVPLTLSISSTAGVAGLIQLKESLGPPALNFYDFHYYGLPGDAAVTLAAAERAVSPSPLYVGETGLSTYSPVGSAQQQAELASQQANYFAAVEVATKTLRLPPAAPWMLNDLVGADVPLTAKNDPTLWYFGLFSADGSAKPAAAVVRQFFSRGTEPPLLNGTFAQSAGGSPSAGAPREGRRHGCSGEPPAFTRDPARSRSRVHGLRPPGRRW